MRRRAVLAAPLLLLAAAPAMSAVGAGPAWRVGPLVTLNGPVPGLRCSNDGEDSAPLVAVDPHSPGRVVATYLTDNGLAQVGATSTDGGHAWTRTLINADTSCTGGDDAYLVDPALYVDSAGYAVSSAGWTKTSSSPTDVNHETLHELTMTSGRTPARSSSPWTSRPHSRISGATSPR